MTRNEAIDLLEKYNDFLCTEGYDEITELWMDEPKTIDRFFETDWVRENLPLIDEKPIPYMPLFKKRCVA